MRRKKKESETVERGKIIRYEPDKCRKAGRSSLYISTGPHVDLVAVPNITGKTEEEADRHDRGSRLLPGSTSTAYSDTVPRGSIISQSGGSNGQIEVGGTINYVVSDGPEVKHQRYVASINQTYDASSLIGPARGQPA